MADKYQPMLRRSMSCPAPADSGLSNSPQEQCLRQQPRFVLLLPVQQASQNTINSINTLERYTTTIRCALSQKERTCFLDLSIFKQSQLRIFLTLSDTSMTQCRFLIILHCDNDPQFLERDCWGVYSGQTLQQHGGLYSKTLASIPGVLVTITVPCDYQVSIVYRTQFPP